MVGGTLAGVAFLLEEPRILPSTPRTAALLYVASAPMLLAGLVALYLTARTYQDGPGKAGRIWLLTGPVMYVASIFLFSLQWNLLAAFGLVGFLAGLGLLAYGLVLVGIANMRTNLLGRLSGMPVLVGVLMLPMTFLGGYAASSSSSVARAVYLVVGMTWCASWALVGYSLYVSGRRYACPRTSMNAP